MENLRLKAFALMHKGELILNDTQLDPNQALVLFKECHKILKQLAEQNSNSVSTQRDLLVILMKIANHALLLNDTSTSKRYSQDALIICQQLVENHPSKVDPQVQTKNLII